MSPSSRTLFNMPIQRLSSQKEKVHLKHLLLFGMPHLGFKPDLLWNQYHRFLLQFNIMTDIGIVKFGRFKKQFRVGENIFVRIGDSGITFIVTANCETSKLSLYIARISFTEISIALSIAPHR